MTDGASAVPAGHAPGPLSGVLVADFSRILAGPYATMLLADLGAEVVKVESPRGDDTRTWTPPARALCHECARYRSRPGAAAQLPGPGAPLARVGWWEYP